ncbi:MAG: STAS domain-containing protein [Planctomycetes bacterium]|nr:STAS domain-containing protein [Planctomycetota bacterium]
MAIYAERPFQMEVARQGQTAVVRVRGFADMTETGEFQDQLANLAGQPKSLIVVDMSELDFINSSGLGALIACHRTAKENGGELRLVKPKPAVMNVLEITRLNELFHICQNIEQAVKPA